MTDSKNDETITCNAKVTFKNKDEYNNFISGKTHSNKGLRTDKGTLRSQPDFEIIDEHMGDYESELDYNYRDYSMMFENNEENYGVGAAILQGILEGLGEFVVETLSDEETRRLLWSMAKNSIQEKAIPGVKKSLIGINKKISTSSRFVKSVISGKTKAEELVLNRQKVTITTQISATNSTLAKPFKSINKNPEYREAISKEEAERQLEQIKVLAILLADRIKRFSNTYIREDEMSPEDYLIQQNTLEELTTQNVLDSIRFLVKNDNFLLDDSALRILSEFLAGNLIIGDKLVPIENYKSKEPLTLNNMTDNGI